MFNLEDYETVEERLVKFWKDHPDGRIFTELLDSDNGRFIVSAAIYRTEVDQHPWCTGLAEETISGRGVNATSALENAETSAIGRALAGAGYATKGKRPSREEMGKVERVKAGEQVKGDVWSVKTGDEAIQAFEALATLNPQVVVEEAKETCDHGVMIYKTGTAKSTGKPWARWDCSWDNKECSKWVNLK